MYSNLKYSYHNKGMYMCNKQIPEILKMKEELRAELNEIMINNPHVELKQRAKEIGFSEQVLRRFIFKNGDLNIKSLLLLYNFLRNRKA